MHRFWCLQLFIHVSLQFLTSLKLGEIDDLHSLIHHLAVSRVRYAGPQKGRRGQLRTTEAEIALSTSFLRKSLSICAVRGQAQALLGRLDVIGPGAAAAAQRRNNALCPHFFNCLIQSNDLEG